MGSIAVLLCLLAAQPEEKPRPVRMLHVERLSWLARHQQPDGRWGPGTCDCFARTIAPPVPRDREVGEKMKPLLKALGSEALAERERATAEIARLDRAALPYLEDASTAGEAEARARVRTIVDRMRAVEGAEDTEATAVALLAFLRGGFSHLSRDEFADAAAPGRVLRFGEAVKSAMKWMVESQGGDGSIGPLPLEGCGTWNALAVFALAEAYGMTATQILRDPVASAVAWLATRQRESGAWGPGRDDPVATYWSVLALNSGRLDDFHVDRRVLARGVEWLRKRAAATGSDADLAAWVGAERLVDAEGDVSAHVKRLARITPRADDPTAYYQVALALYFADGHGVGWRTEWGSRWREWNGRQHAALRERWDQGPPCDAGAGRSRALLCLVANFLTFGP